MALGTKKAGTQFGTVSSGNPEQMFAEICVKVAKEQGLPVNWSFISRCLGTIAAEGGFIKGRMWTSNSKHRGPWALGPNFEGVSDAGRLDPTQSTVAAMKYIKSHGGNTEKGFGAWWPFEESHGEIEGGKKRAAQYVGIAKVAIKRQGGEENNENIFEEVGGAIAGAAEAPFKVAATAEEFLQEALETLLNFEKLGSLAVQAFAWFIRLLAKALWDYVIHPVVAWSERAVSWYWENFFSTGTEKGSGFGYQIRNNAGMITIIFWSVGYAVLWSGGDGSLMPVASHEALLGKTVKGVEGAVARRNLTKPSEVKDKTPKKPTPKTSSVQIEPVDEFSVSRNRPVKVTKSGEAVTGRVKDEQPGHRVPRPKRQRGTEQRQPGGPVAVAPGQAEVQNESGTKAADSNRPRSRSGTVGRPRSKGSGGTGGKARSRA